jgi:hypothetical protein
MEGRILDMEPLLLGDRQGEEALGILQHPVDQRRRHAMAGEIEEADLAAGIGDLGHGVGPAGGTALEEGLKIDDRHAGQRDALSREIGGEARGFRIGPGHDRSRRLSRTCCFA